MKSKAYREYLQKQAVPGAAIGKQMVLMVLIEDFIEFLTESGLMATAALSGKTEVEQFTRQLTNKYINKAT